MQSKEFIDRIRLAVLVPVLLILIFVIAYFFGRNVERNNFLELNEATTGEKHIGGYEFISPLLECRAPSSKLRSSLVLENKIKELIEQEIKEGNISQASVYLRDLNNGPWIGVNEKEEFTPASLMKVPLLISYLKKAEVEPELLDKKIKIIMNQDLALSPNITPLRQVVTGEEYSVRELLEYMIKYSDNLATNTLLVNMDEQFFNKVYYDVGLNPLEQSAFKDFITVRDYAGFFRILYNASYLSRDSSEYALKLLNQTSFKQALVAGLPLEVKIAHKFGERRFVDMLQLHDCGVVYRPGNPYLICVMTKGLNFNLLQDFIAKLSALSYQEF